MTKREKRERLALIVEALKELYPDARCSLEYGGDPWRLLVMGRLSAQCTDARVNIVCRELFREFPDAAALAYADVSRVEQIVKPCGLYKMKAQSIVDASKMLVEDFGGALPDTMEELLSLRGVGRKIANLLLGDLYGKGGIVADTHCIRICGRLGMYDEKIKDPLKVERIMSEYIPLDSQSDFCHRIVQFGRDVCSARSPRCENCPMSDFCARGLANSSK